MRQAGQHESSKKGSFSRCPRFSMEWPSAPEEGWLDLLCSWPALFSGQKSGERSRTQSWARWGSCVIQYYILYNIAHIYMYNMQKYRVWNVEVRRQSIRKSIHWKMFGHLPWDGGHLDALWEVVPGLPLAWNSRVHSVISVCDKKKKKHFGWWYPHGLSWSYVTDCKRVAKAEFLSLGRKRNSYLLLHTTPLLAVFSSKT